MRTRIERFELGDKGFASWLHGWRQLQLAGWSVVVLMDRPGESHCIALAFDDGSVVDPPEPEAQLELELP